MNCYKIVMCNGSINYIMASSRKRAIMKITGIYKNEQVIFNLFGLQSVIKVD